jgi:hypothetical protein
MGLFVKQTEERSELQQKIAMDIEARQRAAAAGDKPVDGVDDSRLIEGTSHLSWAGVVMIIVLVVVIVGIVIFISIK